jgi:hypothetical protein
MCDADISCQGRITNSDDGRSVNSDDGRSEYGRSVKSDDGRSLILSICLCSVDVEYTTVYTFHELTSLMTSGCLQWLW